MTLKSKMIAVCLFAWTTNFTILHANQTLIFTPTYDNLIMENTTDDSVANTVYAHDSANAVGITHSYGYFYNYVAAASLLYFDLSSLSNKTVLNATLYLYVSQYAGDPSGAAVRTDYKVSAIIDNWDPNTVTWNTMPRSTYNYEQKFEVPQVSVFPTTIDVTDIVRQWVSGNWYNYGFILQDAYYQAQYGDYIDMTLFGALEGDSDKIPKLVIEIAEDGGSGTFLPIPPILNFLLY